MKGGVFPAFRHFAVEHTASTVEHAASTVEHAASAVEHECLTSRVQPVFTAAGAGGDDFALAFVRGCPRVLLYAQGTR
jgi:hypothetical protein